MKKEMKKEEQQGNQGAQGAQVFTSNRLGNYLRKLPDAMSPLEGVTMFEIHITEKESAPMLVCGICGGHLHDASAAAAVYDCSVREGSRVQPLYVHKGHIDGRTCHDQADAMIEASGGIPAWQELRDHLMSLVINSGITVEQLLEEERKYLGE